MIKELFSKQTQSITAAAFVVAALSFVSRILGVARDRILAGQLGAGASLDIYYAAFRIPDLIFNLLVLGALSAGFVPIFTGLLKNPLEKVKDVLTFEKNKSAWDLANNVLNIMTVGLSLLTVIGIIFTPELIKLTAPGFSSDQQAQTVTLTRIMFLSPLLLGISGILGGILQSFRNFFVDNLSPIMYNLGIIFGALYFLPRYGLPGLAYGVVLGAFFHMIVQVPSIFKLGFRYKFKFNLKDAFTKKIWVMMVPRTLSLAIAQINLIVVTIMASTLSQGSLSVFNLANNIQSFPLGIFAISYAIAAFPTLSAVAFKNKELIENFSKTLRQILFFIIPSTVLLLTLRAQLIRVVLGSGKFDWQDTILTMHTLTYFAISLFAQAAIPLLVRVFYARHNSRMPFYIGLVSVVANVVLSWRLPLLMMCGNNNVCQPLGVDGLALAFSISSMINFIILWLVLRLELNGLDEKRVLFSTIKLLSAGVVSAAAIQGTKLLVWPYIDLSHTWGVFAQGAIAGSAGILIYLMACSFLKSEEFFDFWGSFKRRLPWRKVGVVDPGEARGI
jgi:putative peptidoglycan lipid II flippase